MIKKHVWEILLVVFFLMNNLYGKPQIIGSKVLSGDQFNASDIFSANLFIDKENDIVIEVEGPDCLWLNNKWVTTKQYGYQTKLQSAPLLYTKKVYRINDLHDIIIGHLRVTGKRKAGIGM